MDKKILIVDDDVDLRASLMDVLQGEGYRVESVGDGAEALNRLHTRYQDYRLVITDVWMPHMGGSVVLQTMIKDHLDVYR